MEESNYTKRHNYKVSVLILSWLRLEGLLQTLSELPRSTSIPLHLILRVQGLEELTKEDGERILRAASEFSSIDIYFTQSNVGSAAGRLDLLHRAAKTTNTPYFLFTDDDISFPQGGIDNLLYILENNQLVGAAYINPKLKHPNAVIDSYDLFSIDSGEEEAIEVFVGGSASLMFHRELYTKHLIAPNGEFFIGGWDYDFIYQIRNAGYKVVTITSKNIINRHGGSPTYRNVRSNRYNIEVGRSIMRHTWGSHPSDLSGRDSRYAIEVPEQIKKEDYSLPRHNVNLDIFKGMSEARAFMERRKRERARSKLATKTVGPDNWKTRMEQ